MAHGCGWHIPSLGVQTCASTITPIRNSTTRDRGQPENWLKFSGNVLQTWRGTRVHILRVPATLRAAFPSEARALLFLPHLPLAMPSERPEGGIYAGKQFSRQG